MNKKIGITGGSGLLGKILIKILKKKKIKFSLFKKDIRSSKEIKKWLIDNRDINIVFHLAAIFFASTAHVYEPKNKLLTEKDNLKPISFYGKTKLMSEKFLLKNKNKKIKICIGRIFNIFHQKQKKPFFYPLMVAKYKKNKNMSVNKLILKNGNSFRDFTNAEKVVEIIFKLSEKKAKGIFNIGSGKKITLLQFIRKYINNKVEIKPMIKRDMIVANVNKLKRLSII